MHDFIEGCCKAEPSGGEKRKGIKSGNCQKQREKRTKQRPEKVNMKVQEMEAGVEKQKDRYTFYAHMRGASNECLLQA